MSLIDRYKNKSTLIPLLSIPLWFIVFPHTFWFMKLWACLTTAIFLSIWVGFFSEYKNKEQFSFSGKSYPKKQYHQMMFGSLIFASVSLVLMAPDMAFQELKLSHFRNLSLSGIDEIVIEYSDGRKLIVNKENGDLVDFVELLKNAKLFNPVYSDQKESMNSFSLTMILSDGEKNSYKARIPKSNKEDISLFFNEYVFINEILIPKGSYWIVNVRANKTINQVRQEVAF